MQPADQFALRLNIAVISAANQKPGCRDGYLLARLPAADRDQLGFHGPSSLFSISRAVAGVVDI
jgi:hypothetical protein